MTIPITFLTETPAEESEASLLERFKLVFDAERVQACGMSYAVVAEAEKLAWDRFVAENTVGRPAVTD